MGMDDDVNIASLFTENDITILEKTLNPEGIAYPPPKSWVCPKFEKTIDTALGRCHPSERMSNEELRQAAKSYLTEELNSILELRIKGDSLPMQAWKSEQFPGNEPFSHIAFGAHDGNNPTVNRNHPSPSKKRKKLSYHNSTNNTLPFEPECTKSTSNTSTSTGPTPCTPPVGGREPPKHTSEKSGPSPGRAASHSSRRRGSGRGGAAGGVRANQPRSGPHVCDHPGCGKSFQYPSKLVDHKHTHGEDKHFRCSVESCSKRFKRSRELKAHEKTHPRKPDHEGDQDMEDVKTVCMDSHSVLTGRTGRSDDGHHGSAREPTQEPSLSAAAIPPDDPPPSGCIEDDRASSRPLSSEMHAASASPPKTSSWAQRPWMEDRTPPIPQGHQTPELKCSSPEPQREGPRMKSQEINDHIDSKIIEVIAQNPM